MWSGRYDLTLGLFGLNVVGKRFVLSLCSAKSRLVRLLHMAHPSVDSPIVGDNFPHAVQQCICAHIIARVSMCFISAPICSC